MGTIAQKLTYLEDTKTAIGNAIAAKGGSVTGKTFRQYATEIENLPSGGGGTPIAVSKDVSDYTGGTSFNFKIQITDVNFPSGITSIAAESFSGCAGLTSVTIPNTVTSINNQAFYFCTGLTSISIPDSVTELFFQCLCGCSNLTSITVGSGITYIGRNVFDLCSSLTSITINATTPPNLDSFNAFNRTNDCPIYVPAASVDTYKAANQWSNLASRIQAIPSE